jgi:hypothetical protein
MKKTMKSLLIFSFVALLGVTFSSGCRKKKDTTAKITVRGENNALVIGATVRVYGESSTTPKKASVVDDTQSSDYKGEAFFSYNDIYQLGQAGVAVLNIEVTYGAKIGTGIIKIESEVANEETVYIE